MTITERRIVKQDWYETECSKTGWDSNGWYFADTGHGMGNDWTIVEYLHLDKHSNAYVGVAEKDTNVDGWNPTIVYQQPDYEYEMFFQSEGNDIIKIDGWYPIETARIHEPENIEKYIKNGILRKIKK